MLNKELKETLYINLKPIYDRAQPKLNKEEIMERIEVFSMVLSFASTVENANLKNVENDIIHSIERIRISAKQYITEEVNLLETYLRLLCFIVDRRGFDARHLDLLPLSILYSHQTIDVLNTKGHPERLDYYRILTEQNYINKKPVPFLYSDPRHAEKNARLINDKEIFPFVEAYCFRNMLGEQLNMEAQWEHFLCMFYTMIETTYKHKEKIIPLFIRKEISYKNYTNKIIEDYETKLGQNFTYIPLNIEILQNDLKHELENLYEDLGENLTFEDVNKDINQNEIMLSNDIAFNKVKIIGYAGMGKTTTIENIIYKEAQELKDNAYIGKIPVMIKMIKASSKEDTIESLLAKKLNTTNMLVIKELIKRNMINLYIDGINEIMISNNQEKREYLNKIEEFIIINNDLKVVITDRDNNENSILNDYPTFILTGVTRKNIEEFINGNSTKPEIVNEKILSKIDENPNFLYALKNPFMLKNLITIIECNKEIPEYEDDIAEEFLKAIVERETKRDYKASHILKLLTYVVGKYVEENSENVDNNMIISCYKLIKLFDEYFNKYKINDRFNNNEMLDLIVKLDILKQVDTDKYMFTNEEYYYYIYFLLLSNLE